MFKDAAIDGVKIKKIQKYEDQRGWLIELFRQDELEADECPVMSYVSETKPGIARGPHEHEFQTDYFAFIGPSTFKIYLWDNRKQSQTFGNRMVIQLGEEYPGSVIIPPGVVHAYKNSGKTNGWVFNAPNKLFAGKNKKEAVDEIRHEDDANTLYQLD